VTEGSKDLVLVVDDRRETAEVQAGVLRRVGFAARTECDGAAGLRAIRRYRPDAVILDISMPTIGGLDICRALRAAGNWVPVLMVGSPDQTDDAIAALGLGADDYVTAPYSPRELAARVTAVLRRWKRSARMSPVRTAGQICLELNRMTAVMHGRVLDLSTKEFQLLAYLAERPGTVCSHEELLGEVWDGTVDVQVVSLCVAHIQAKLGSASPLHIHGTEGISIVSDR
jgi:DNA-binding response OmpR family regulator